MEVAAPAAGISWDIGSVVQTGDGGPAEATAGIDWAIDLSDTGTAGAESAPPAVTIDWDIGGLSASAPPEVAPEGISTASKGGSHRVEGRTAVVLRVERDADFRSRLTEDLQELRAFLLQV